MGHLARVSQRAVYVVGNGALLSRYTVARAVSRRPQVCPQHTLYQTNAAGNTACDGGEAQTGDGSTDDFCPGHWATGRRVSWLPMCGHEASERSLAYVRALAVATGDRSGS